MTPVWTAWWINVAVPLPLPVQVSRDDPGFDRLVDEHHQRFCDAMMELWDAHKDK
jgi:hypothetical protein